MVHTYLMHNGCIGLKHRCYAAQTEIAIFCFSTAEAYFIINFPSIAMPFNSNAEEKAIFDKLISIYHVMSGLVVVCAMKETPLSKANTSKHTYNHPSISTHSQPDRPLLCFLFFFFSFCLFCLFPYTRMAATCSHRVLLHTGIYAFLKFNQKCFPFSIDFDFDKNSFALHIFGDGRLFF